jgi:hypothetical protein
MQSVKLSVTVRGNLERKYDKMALKKIDAAVKEWIAADTARGLKTIHVAVDDEKAMKALGVRAVHGSVTANKMKHAVDLLWSRLRPDYLVLFGAGDVVPYFVVDNPSYDPNGDDDRKVPTDNPYACSHPFQAKKKKSFLVPDRVIGRIPDVPEESDPAWFIDYLNTAMRWAPQKRSVYSGAYAICCDAWKKAGIESIEAIGEDAKRLMIAPPDKDGTARTRSRLGARLHMIKCHGAPIDPCFYGQKGSSYPVTLSSNSLKKRVKARTIVGAMCCYGAQSFSPRDPALSSAGAWPISSTYLRRGAYGFAGSTMIAWVGSTQMQCADWIVTAYLKGALQGASLGRSFLEAKQDYFRWIRQQGGAPGVEDEKTLLEYVLLGDPSIQPVAGASTPVTPAAGGRAREGTGGGGAGARRAAIQASLARPSSTTLQERRQRRLFRAVMADQIREGLPARTSVKGAAMTRAGALFSVVKDLLRRNATPFGFRRSKVRVHKLETRFTSPDVAAAGYGARGARGARVEARATRQRESYEYYWTGRRRVDGHKQVRLVRVETDMQGRVLRSRMVESS